MKSTKKLVFVSLLIALSLVVSLVEGMIPLPVAIPGAKLGFSNILIVVTLSVFSFGTALIVSLMKSFLLMLITGSVTSFAYSFCGALLSCLVMGVSNRFLRPPFSLIGVSELGALAHNFGQLLVAMVVLGNPQIFIYMPVLTLMGVFTGFFVGFSGGFIAQQLKRVFQWK